jgi:predicted NACHT family NTPase
VALYLARLVRWLNTDPWPQDTRFAGPALTPAAIERKLRITSHRDKDEADLEADDLARRCHRLVVLGGPGTGKTWLARRTARLCAEAALTALAAGAQPAEVELRFTPPARAWLRRHPISTFGTRSWPAL